MKDNGFYENLSSSYKKTVHSIVNSYKKLEKENIIIFIIAVISLVLNIILLGKCFDLTFQNDKLNKELIKEYDKNVYLKSQNEDLWETYYSGVTEYKYYE